ncbi:MAG TPA: biotin-independent malonate decarboxylase subunit beta, partial [Rhodoferax sp.]|nr:biotin-independent malonate decarboxylase subunit beta [Rhodoferax sp.]
TGDCDVLLEDEVAQFRSAAVGLLNQARPLSLAALEAEHALLAERLRRDGDCRDALDIWQRAGVPEPLRVTDMEADAIVRLRDTMEHLSKEPA